MIVVEVGRRGGHGWLAAARSAARGAYARPAGVLGAAGVVALTAFIGVLVLPLLIPVLLGYALLALHAVAYRLS
jgi:hypothetical protein